MLLILVQAAADIIFWPAAAVVCGPAAASDSQHPAFHRFYEHECSLLHVFSFEILRVLSSVGSGLGKEWGCNRIIG